MDWYAPLRLASVPMKLLATVRREVAGFFELQADTDFFALLDVQLIVSAIQLHSRKLLARALFRLYQLLLPLQYAIWLLRIWVASVIDQNTTLAISLACGAFALTSVVIRYGLLLLSHDKFGAVRAYINSRRYYRGDRRAHEIRERAFRTNNSILLLVQLYGLVNIVVFNAFNLAQHDIFRIPDYFRQLSEPLYRFMQVAMQPMVMSGLATYTAGFLMMNALLIGLRAELQLVQFSFQRVLGRVDDRAHRAAPYLNCRSREDLLWRTLTHELGFCVREHCRVLKHVREMRRIFSISITIQYYTTLLALAIDAFFISYHGFDFVAFMVVVFSVLLVFEWFYCCKLIEDLQAIHRRIGWTIYSDNWTGWLRCSNRHRSSLRQFRAALSTILVVSQRNMSIHGSDIVEVSWRSFSVLFKTSYSVMMFLIELRKVNRAS